MEAEISHFTLYCGRYKDYSFYGYGQRNAEVKHFALIPISRLHRWSHGNALDTASQNNDDGMR